MIWVLLAIVVVLLIVVAVLVRRQMGLSASASAATATIEATKAQVLAVRQEVTDAQGQVAAAHLEVTAAKLATEHAEARAGLAESGLAFSRAEMAASQARAQIEALWAMAGLEQNRAWRLTMALPADPGAGVGHSPTSLAVAMDREVERIREETGTPGTLTLGLPDDLDPGDALMVLKAVQGLMAVLTRNSDAFDLSLVEQNGGIVATLVCDGFDGPDAVADEVTALLEALQAQAEIDVDRDASGRLEGRLTVALSR